MHVNAGASSPETVRLVGKLNQQFVIILIDTCNTRNFIEKIETLLIFLLPEKGD